MISIGEYSAIVTIGNGTTTATPARTPEGDYALRLRDPHPDFIEPKSIIALGQPPRRKMIREEILLMFDDTEAIDALISELHKLKGFQPSLRIGD